ncbi:hypothetical protein, partial [Streptomyces parvulus]|uniref:hypothetical protein n=1 Tax=Streptomyces parvulus TaxID=146923 RepID=UPI0033A7B05E
FRFRLVDHVVQGRDPLVVLGRVVGDALPLRALTGAPRNSNMRVFGSIAPRAIANALEWKVLTRR